MDVEERAVVFRALGDPCRLAVVDMLAAQDLSPDALGAALDLPSNLLAHHLKALRAAGVVSRRHSQHDRRRAYLHLNSERLQGLLPIRPHITAQRVVFVCTLNSARSVLAEALWTQVSNVPAASAGTRPAARVNPRARTAARRARVRLPTRTPKPLRDVLRDDDVIITVCDAVNEELPDLPNIRLHWSVPDPVAEDTDEAFAATVEDLRARIDRTAATITAQPSTSTRVASGVHPR